ncbi:MAG: hypothetical protein J6Z46_02635 [Lachnospiraceae bacterium]|nr:hypothetical protein [Lachnospiraceae bacterium]
MKKTKTIPMLLVVSLMLSVLCFTPTKAYAVTDDKDEIVVYYSEEDMPTMQNNAGSKVIDESFRGASAPIYFYDLSLSSYHYSFSEVINFTFTQYYFKPSSTGWLTLSMNNWDSGGDDVRIEVFRKTIFGLDELVHVWTGNPELYSGIGFPSLDPDKNYYFKFMAYHADSVSGTGYIYQ